MPQTLEQEHRRFAALVSEAQTLALHPALMERLVATTRNLGGLKERSERLGPMVRALHADVINAIENGRRFEETADVTNAYREMGSQ